MSHTPQRVRGIMGWLSWLWVSSEDQLVTTALSFSSVPRTSATSETRIHGIELRLGSEVSVARCMVQVWCFGLGGDKRVLGARVHRMWSSEGALLLSPLPARKLRIPKACARLSP